MTSGPAPSVDHHTLTLGSRLGQGGQGTVYEVTNKKINKASGDGWDVAYKEYSATVLPELDAAALAAQVNLLGELSGTEGRWLCDKTAWPAALVRRGDRTCGFLMRAVPDRFQFTYRSLSGTAQGTRRLANLEYLLNDDDYVAGIGLTVSERDRLLILADLADTLAELHRIGITVGDLSPKNLLFTTGPRPECFLIDCDAMRLRGATVLPQAETPDWQVPPGEEKATRASDVHKLALLAVRLFARDQTAVDPDVLTPLDPALADLARAGLDPDPARRPAPAAWAELLTAASDTASTAPAAPSPTRATIRRPPTPPAQRRRNPRQEIAAVLGVIAFLVLALVLGSSLDGSGSESGSGSSGSSPTTTSPEPDPSYEEEYPEETDSDTTYPEDEETTYEEETPEDEETTYEEETPETEEPEPPPSNYGAIAISGDGTTGRAWDYDSENAASQAALDYCDRSDCKVLTTFVNGCGAIAYNRATNRYWGGRGPTRAAAQRDAISRAGGGGWVDWACTTRY